MKRGKILGLLRGVLVLAIMVVCGCSDGDRETPAPPTAVPPPVVESAAGAAAAVPVPEEMSAPVRFYLRYQATEGGSLIGPVAQEIEAGEDAFAVAAVADEGFRFVGWSDGAVEPQRSDQRLTADLEVTARFAPVQYRLEYVAGDNGRITGPTAQQVDQGREGKVVVAVADEGYHFVRWNDGVTTAQRAETQVRTNVTVTAEFAVNEYPVSYRAGEFGSLKGATTQRVRHGEETSAVEAVADPGYHFVRWSDGVTTRLRVDRNVRADLTVRADFAINTYVIGGVVKGLVEGTRMQIENAGDRLVIDANGFFRFVTEALDGESYSVRVTRQPEAPNQSCSLTGAQGQVAGQDVDGIIIECVLKTFSVGGMVSGLPDGNEIVLQNKGRDRLQVSADGPFVFPVAMEDGSSYEVEVARQPRRANWICAVLRPYGLLAGKDVDNVEVDCYPQVVLEAEGGMSKVRLGWNSADFSGVTFELCQAREEIIGADFNQCRRLQGGTVRTGVGEGLIIEGLRNNQPYWFQLLARYDSGRLTFSDAVTAVPYGGLNDTGIDWCADTTRNRDVGVRGEKIAGCESVADSHPGQDAIFGRDQEMLQRALKKNGSGSAGFDFTRICRSGEAAGEGRCPPNPVPGKGFDNWGCNRDNVTGLIWELKDDSGLGGMDHTYSWYQPDATVNGGDAGVENGGRCTGSKCDTSGYITAVSKEKLCGVSDWRLPTRKELLSIVDNGRFNPALDARQFPDVLADYYWTSSPYGDNSRMAWQVYFLYGEALPAEKKLAKPVRLVSGETVTFGMDNP